MAGFRELVESSGHPASAAAVLCVLLEVESTTTEEISRRSQLKGSQVVYGLRYWRDRGWVSSSLGSSTGRGRPPHLWSLSISKAEVCRSLQSELNRELLTRRGRLVQVERMLRILVTEE